ncbi:hypothetical protein D3C78_1374350 [compost metagenome]
MVNTIGEPGLPRMLSTASFIDWPLVGLPSICTIRSPGWMPARAAGVSSMGETTLMKPSSVPTSMPRPPNSPLVLSCSSENSCGSRYAECGSRLLSMPLMAFSSRVLSSIGST